MVKTIRPRSSLLRSYIHSFNICKWNWSDLIQSGNSLKGIANGLIAISIWKGDPFFISHDGLSFQKMKSSYISGLSHRYAIFKGNGKLEMIIINMFPWAVNVFFDFPPSSISSYLVDIADCLQRSFLQMAENMLEKDMGEHALTELEAYFLEELKRERGIEDFIPYSHRIIDRGNQTIEIKELASAVGLSRQHFTRLFKQKIGMPPKQFAQLVRIRSCVDTKFQHHKKSLTTLAHEHDFHDQAHFIHLFKKMTGECPHAYFQQKHFVDVHLAE